MSEHKSKLPPIVEIPEGSEDFLAGLEKDQTEHDIDLQTGDRIETDARTFWLGKYAGERAVQLLTQKGELLGVVTRTNKETQEKTPVKVIDLGEDFGTEVQLNNPNYRAASTRLGLPEGEDAIQQVFDAREDVKRALEAQEEAEIPLAAQPVEAPHVPRDRGADYRARQARKRATRTEVDDEDDDNTGRSWMISGY